MLVNIGLPSGNLWESKNTLTDLPGTVIPEKKDFEELIESCSWLWAEERAGGLCTGPNGNSLFFPANTVRGTCRYRALGPNGTELWLMIFGSNKQKPEMMSIDNTNQFWDDSALREYALPF